MDLSVSNVVPHLVTFGLGVATWLPFTLWQGRVNRNERDTVTEVEPEQIESEETPRHRSLRLSTVVALVVILSSLFVVGLGWQQNRFQHKQTETAQCVSDWGKDVTTALDKRATGSAELTSAERAKGNASDNVLLLFLTFKDADPPISKAEQARLFYDRLNKFSVAKDNLTAEDEKFKQTKKTYAYPTLDC